MIDISRMNLFPFKTNDIGFAPANVQVQQGGADGAKPQQVSKPLCYNIIVFPENCEFLPEYSALGIRRVQVRSAYLPVSPMLKVFRNSDSLVPYRQAGLVPTFDPKAIADHSLFIDIGPLVAGMERRYGAGNYRRPNMARMLLSMIDMNRALLKAGNRKDVLLYIVDLDKPLATDLRDRRFFPVFDSVRHDQGFHCDYLLFCAVSAGVPHYFLLNRPAGGVEKSRLLNIMLQIKQREADGQPAAVVPQEDIEKAADGMLADAGASPDEKAEAAEEADILSDAPQTTPKPAASAGVADIGDRGNALQALRSYLNERPEIAAAYLKKN